MPVANLYDEIDLLKREEQSLVNQVKCLKVAVSAPSQTETFKPVHFTEQPGSRSGQLWSSEEDYYLEKVIEKFFNKAAKDHGRTLMAIAWRIDQKRIVDSYK